MAKEIEQAISLASAEIAASFADFDERKFKSQDQSPISFFIFGMDGQLKYWTSNDFIPRLSVVQENSTGSVLTNRHGEFIFRSQEIMWEGKASVIVGLIPIRRTYSISNPLLQDRYNRLFISGNLNISKDENAIPVRYNGQTLFYIKSAKGSFYNEDVNRVITGLLILLLMGSLRIIYSMATWLKENKNVQLAALFLIVALAFLRMIIIVVSLPVEFGKLSIFEAGTFSYNWFYPSLGDGIINLLFINLVLVFLLFTESRKINQTHEITRLFGALVLILTSYSSLYLFSDSIQIFQRNASLSLDIAGSLAFSDIRIAAFTLIILLALFFFLVHFLAYRFVKIQVKDRKKELYIHILATIVILFFALFNDILWVAIFVNIPYLVGIYYFKMPDNLSSFRFSSINYLLFTCIVLAFVGSTMIYKGYEKKERYGMQRFASFLQLDRDIEGEYILSDIVDQIQLDEELIQIASAKSFDMNAIENRIQRVYLKNYFHDYEIDVYFFNKEGLGISNRYRGQNLDKIKSQFQDERFKTAYPNIFYDGRTDHNKRKKYTCFSLLGRTDSIICQLQIELTLRKFSSKRVLPQLLREKNANQNSYDYAFLVDGIFNFTSGNYEYEASFDLDWLDNNELYSKGIERNGYQHLAVKVGKRITIVSKKTYSNIDIISNFSFLFIVLLTAISLSIAAIILLDKRKKGDFNFSTKIMVYSIASFVLPLILVAVAVLSTTDRSNKSEIEKSNLKGAFLVAENLDDILNAFYLKNINKGQLDNEINELALHAGRDLNVYDEKGVLLASSTPEIFDKAVISRYLNPKVQNAMNQQGKESVTLSETIGGFSYKSSYVSINSPDTGKLLGVLASPYFGSKNHVKRQQLQVFGNIINIFTFIFIFSIWLAYWVVSRLTRPIVRIADKLHETGFVDTNQPLEWNADDEIGKLVKEYNNMLSKLEATKMELARNEKEAAWREMAKQVAHEIKNPLTPMKLTIQHLSRVLNDTKVDKKSVDVLLNQIDTLDDIVTSFSHFAKMPSPENAPFDIIQAIHKSIDLHVGKNIEVILEEDKCLVFGDKKLFGRIFNNLILNAFESMKAIDNPMLVVKQVINESGVILSFTDTGEGIPENIRDKVFIPNFSTKDAGSGIGLAVAKRGIEHAGGEIWFESSIKNGTTFFIQLPLYNKK
ncbi:MAG: HAMP domain-containing histidine kinase [Reichenbachiella sp.]